MIAEDIRQLATEAGLDAVGVARAEPYAETERHIAERRERGLFAEMKFTMAQPERLVSSRSAAARRAERRLGGALLLARPNRPLERG